MTELLVLLLAVAHAFDYLSFLGMIGEHGLAAEANPVVLRVTSELGLPGLTLGKLAVVTMASATVVLLRRRNTRLATAVVAFSVLAGVFGGLSNVACSYVPCA
jgi:hypothetical protein